MFVGFVKRPRITPTAIWQSSAHGPIHANRPTRHRGTPRSGVNPCSKYALYYDPRFMARSTPPLCNGVQTAPCDYLSRQCEPYQENVMTNEKNSLPCTTIGGDGLMNNSLPTTYDPLRHLADQPGSKVLQTVGGLDVLAASQMYAKEFIADEDNWNKKMRLPSSTESLFYKNNRRKKA